MADSKECARTPAVADGVCKYRQLKISQRFPTANSLAAVAAGSWRLPGSQGSWV